MFYRLLKLKGILICGALAVCGSHAFAVHVSPEGALDRALQEKSSMKIKGSARFELSYTESAPGLETVYVFSNTAGEGFIVTPADDSFPAVLGYSTTAMPEGADMAPAFKWWLGEYSREIAWAVSHPRQQNRIAQGLPLEALDKAPAKANRAPIATLVSSLWNQSAPFNNDCPVSGSQRSVTGCVATAMAQVIYTHRYPVQGQGTHSYSWNGQTLSFDYGSTQFDWANMIDNYNNGSNAAQKRAVSQLMYGCGVSVNMQYSPSASGAFGLDVPYALKTYFNYDKGVQYLLRDNYTLENWENIVYEDLAAGRPIIFGGQANDGGHEFVCDGYEDGKYHFNWGWGGLCDGYFLLTALNPDDQGIGGFEGGYNSDQHIVCRIQKPTAGTTPWYPIYAKGGLDPTLSGGMLMIAFDGKGIFNFSPESVTVQMGLSIVAEDGTVIAPQSTNSVNFSGASNGQMSGYGGFYFNVPTGLAAGTYKLYITFKTPEGNYQNVQCPAGDNDYLEMTVAADGSVSITRGQPQIQSTIKILSITPQSSTVISGAQNKFRMTAQNTSSADYTGLLTINICERGTESPEQTITLNFNSPLGANATMNFSFFADINVEDGVYDMICYDKYGNKVSDPLLLLVGDASIGVEEVSFSIHEKELNVGQEFSITATISPDDATDKELTWTSSDKSVATVASGRVRATGIGTALITATAASGVADTCRVVVKPVLPASVGLNAINKELTVGDEFTLTATVSPSNATDKTVTWTVSDPAVASVDAGVVKALAVGEATVTATTVNGLTATCTVKVKEKVVEVTAITLDVTENTMDVGGALKINATVDPADATDKTLTWSSSDPAVASVDGGIVYALATGETIITATAVNGVKATCKITVIEAIIDPVEITLDVTEKTLTEGDEFTLTATLSPEDVTDNTITWISSDISVATVSDGGVVKAVSAGEAVITARAVNGLEAKCAVTVEARIIEPTGISLDTTVKTLTEGEEFTLTATVAPDDATDKTVTWTSSNTDVATVADGVVSALSAGRAIITAYTSNGFKATCNITVKAPDVLATSITLDRTAISGYPGDEFTLKATVLPDDATDKRVEWISSDNTIATVTQTGLVTIVAAGECTVSAWTMDGTYLHAECTVTAKTSSIRSIISDADGQADIYNLSGILLKADADDEFVESLAPGIYIVRINGQAYKALKY